MRIALIADVFSPGRTSAAVQLRDLAREMIAQGHQPTVFLPAHDIVEHWHHELVDGVDVMRLRAPRTKDIGYLRRTVAECLISYFMLWSIRCSPLAETKWDGVVWYSPTIFLGPVSKALKKRSGCRSYLIVRDIFPEWAADMGVMRRGLAYKFFKMVADYQYDVADTIGIQTSGNRPYFKDWISRTGGRLEILHNWLAPTPFAGCSISLADTCLAGRQVFVYAGNMGVAQGAEVFLRVAESLRTRRPDIGFLFVGRGSEVAHMRTEGVARGLSNVVFCDEIAPDEISGLYAQCQVGLVALNINHKTHNIPGKFLSYMQSGLPVLASINPSSDLEELINVERVGKASTDGCIDSLASLAEELLVDIGRDEAFASRCMTLAHRLFSPQVAVKQIIDALRSNCSGD